VASRTSPRRTGTAKRKNTRRVGAALVQERRTQPPKTAKEAYDHVRELGRTALAEGYSLRVDASEDARAFPAVEKLCHAHEAEFAERDLHPLDVKAAGVMAARLAGGMVEPPVGESRPSRRAKSTDGSGAADVSIPRKGAAFVAARRKALSRVTKFKDASRNRHAFGVGTPVNPDDAASVLAGAKALKKGLAEHPKSRAAALLAREGAGPNRVRLPCCAWRGPAWRRGMRRWRSCLGRCPTPRGPRATRATVRWDVRARCARRQPCLDGRRG
jgi:hypothetical protein